MDPSVRTVEPPRLVERCSRCGGKAATLWERDASQWWMCDKHNRIHGPKLRGLGFTSYRLIDA